MAELKRALGAKATEMSGMGTVMVHDLLLLTNDFLSDKKRARKSSKGEESLFVKMQMEATRQRAREVCARVQSFP